MKHGDDALRAGPGRPPPVALVWRLRGGRARAAGCLAGAASRPGAAANGTLREREVDPAGRALGIAAARFRRGLGAGRRPVANERAGPRALPAAVFRLHLPGLQPVPLPDGQRAVGDGPALGRGSVAASGPAAGGREARSARTGPQRGDPRRPALGGREAAGGRRARPAEATAVLLRRRADRLAGLGPRRASHPTAALGRPRGRRGGVPGRPRPAADPVRRPGPAPGRRATDRRAGPGGRGGLPMIVRAWAVRPFRTILV